MDASRAYRGPAWHVCTSALEHLPVDEDEVVSLDHECHGEVHEHHGQHHRRDGGVAQRQGQHQELVGVTDTEVCGT